LNIQGVQTPNLSRGFQQIGHTVEVPGCEYLVLQGLEDRVVILVELGAHCGNTFKTGAIEIGHVPIDITPCRFNAATFTGCDLPQRQSLSS